MTQSSLPKPSTSTQNPLANVEKTLLDAISKAASIEGAGSEEAKTKVLLLLDGLDLLLAATACSPVEMIDLVAGLREVRYHTIPYLTLHYNALLRD